MGEQWGEPNADRARRSPRWFWWLAGLAFLALCFWLDQPIYDFLHQHYNIHTRPVPWFLKVTTRVLRSMEDWGENVYILCVLVAMWRLDTKRRGRIVCTIAAAILVNLSVEGVKRVTGRERPEVSRGRFVAHGPAVWNRGGDFQSFPSGHTASAASFSGSLAAFYPPLRPVAIALAAGCGANRIWKERHFLSDCVVGGFFGFWFASSLPRRKRVQPLLAWLNVRLSPRGGKRTRAPDATYPRAA